MFFRHVTDKAIGEERPERSGKGATGDLLGTTFLAEKSMEVKAMDNAWCVRSPGRWSKGESLLPVSKGQRGGRRPNHVGSWSPLQTFGFYQKRQGVLEHFEQRKDMICLKFKGITFAAALRVTLVVQNMSKETS